MSIRSVRNIYTGRVIRLDLEEVELPNGATAPLEIVHHPGGAAIVAIDEQARVCLLRQYRHAAGGWIWELPAGKIDDREPPLQTARRELQEEAGMIAGEWLSLGDCLSSPGILTETVHLFLATRLQPAPHRPEEHEVLEVHWLPFETAYEMGQSGELRDAKSLAGIFRAGAHLRSQETPRRA